MTSGNFASAKQAMLAPTTSDFAECQKALA